MDLVVHVCQVSLLLTQLPDLYLFVVVHLLLKLAEHVPLLAVNGGLGPFFALFLVVILVPVEERPQLVLTLLLRRLLLIGRGIVLALVVVELELAVRKSLVKHVLNAFVGALKLGQVTHVLPARQVQHIGLERFEHGLSVFALLGLRQVIVPDLASLRLRTGIEFGS